MRFGVEGEVGRDIGEIIAQPFGRLAPGGGVITVKADGHGDFGAVLAFSIMGAEEGALGIGGTTVVMDGA